MSREVDSIDFGLRALGDCVRERRQCTDQNRQVESQDAILCQTVSILPLNLSPIVQRKAVSALQ